jgi:putative nucleotidyltransferase with HDIG domain
MATPRTRVLIVDDDASFAGMLRDLLDERGYQAAVARDPADALVRLDDGLCPVALVDLFMPEMGGMELAAHIHEKSPDTQVVILTGYGDMQSAIEGIQKRIFDYLEKADLDAPRLVRTVEAAAERARLSRHNRELTARLQSTNRLLTALHEVSAHLTGQPHQDRVLEHLVRAARDLCSAATARAVLLRRAHGGALVVTAAEGDGAEALVGARLPPGEGISALVADTGTAVRIPEGPAHPAFSPRIDAMPTLLPGLLAAPLRHGTVLGALLVAGRARHLFTDEEQELLVALARQGAVAVENASHQEQSLNFFTHVSEILVTFLESMDVFYSGHSRGVAALADMVTRRLGLSDAERRSIHFGALLHDVGKVLLDPAVLKEEGPATPEALEILRQHPRLGAQFLQPISLWEDILPVIHGHHERWDGRGYPSGQKGEEIPLGARVVAVADAFDAMTRARPHGTCRTPDEALAELEACAGSQFDPRIVRLFAAEYRQRGHQLPPS